MDEVKLGGLWCREVLGLLDGYVDGSLSADELAQVTEHVSGCSVCAAFGGAYARTVEALRSGEPEALDADRARRLAARIAEEIA